VIPLVAAAYLVAAPPSLPSGAVRYRVEISGAGVGVVDLSVACRAARGACTIRWEARLRLPGEAGGGLWVRRVRAVVGTDGALLAPPEVEVNGARRSVRAQDGAVPLSAAEIVLGVRGGSRCSMRRAVGAAGPAPAREGADSRSRCSGCARR